MVCALLAFPTLQLSLCLNFPAQLEEVALKCLLATGHELVGLHPAFQLLPCAQLYGGHDVGKVPAGDPALDVDSTRGRVLPEVAPVVRTSKVNRALRGERLFRA